MTGRVWYAEGSSEWRRSLVTLQDGAVRLWRGLSPLLTLTIPPETPVTASQVLHFPQPPQHRSAQAPTRGRHARKPSAVTDPVIPPHASDNQFYATLDDEAVRSAQFGVPEEEHAVRELGDMIGVTHGCGNTFLLHFGCGANLQVRACGALRCAGPNPDVYMKLFACPYACT